MTDYRSYTHNLGSCDFKAWKKFRPKGDSKPWPLQYWCSTLPAELSIHIWQRGPFLEGPHKFSHPESRRKIQTAWLQSCFIQFFLIWTKIPYIQAVSAVTLLRFEIQMD